MKPSLPLPEYANAYVSESTCTRELYLAISVSCSKLFPSDCVITAVMLPSLSIVNVEMKPSLSAPSYANAYVSESTCTRELWLALSVSCSKLATSVIVVPSDEMVNVEMNPSVPVPVYANAYVSESTCTREAWAPRSRSCSKLFPSDCVFTAVMSPAAADASGSGVWNARERVIVNKTAKETRVRFFECLFAIIKYESPFSLFTESGILLQIKLPLFCWTSVLTSLLEWFYLRRKLTIWVFL